MLRKIVWIAGLTAMLCLPAPAQQNLPFEIGIKGGAGGYGYSDDTAHRRGVVGADVCALCAGRFSILGEYNHFFAPAVGSYQAAELFGAGLRIQGRGRVRPFFDAGFAAGYSRFGAFAGTRTITTAGGGLGFGVRIAAGEHFYVRPQVRVYVMSQQYLAASAGVGVGWRF